VDNYTQLDKIFFAQYDAGMSESKEKILQPERLRFKFDVRIDKEHERVILIDGAEEYIFVRGPDGKPFLRGQPLHEISPQKLQDLMRQAAGILQDRFSDTEEK